MKKYDAIVVGAGHNGLTNAAFLAKAGLDVLVLEKNHYVGGATASLELHKDWRYSNCSYVCSLFRPEIYQALDLGRHGLEVVPLQGSVTFKQNGDYFGSYHQSAVKRREIARHSKRDADATIRFDADLMKWCRLIRGFLLRTPPDPASFKIRDAMEFAHLLKSFYSLSESQIYEFIRFFTMSIAEYLEQYFENDTVLAHYSGGSIIGTGLGVYSPGTAYVLLHHAMGDVDGNVGSWGFARGGMGSVSAALASSLQALGGEIRTQAEVAKIAVKGKRATGVILASGEEISARAVISNLDAKRTFLNIMDASDLPEDLVRRANNFKIRGSSGKVNIALDGMPEFPALPKGSPLTLGHMHFTDTLERLERAYDDWKDDRWSQDPYVDMVIPTQYDPSMSPPGKHMMSVFVQYCPVEAEGGWTDAKRDAFGATVIEKHFTLNRADGGVDSAFSLEPKELSSLVTETKRAWDSLGSVMYGPTKEEEKSLIFKRSIYVVEDIQKGETFTSKNLRIIRPGDGCPPSMLPLLLGKKALNNYKKGTPLNAESIL